MAYFLELTRSDGPIWINIDQVVSIRQDEKTSILVYAGGNRADGFETIMVRESAAEILAIIPKAMKEWQG